ncbi:MAG: MarR family winged helix-turn-helix transcriptional regulator [Candidatus Faecivicinus sp.]
MIASELRSLITLGKRAYDQAMEPVCARHEITRMELDVLLFLANNPGHDTAAELVSLRGLTKSHVSAAVASLTERGLLTGSHRGGNRKTIHLAPLPAAQAIIADGCAAQQRLHAALLQGFTPAERALLQGAGDRFMQNLYKILE